MGQPDRLCGELTKKEIGSCFWCKRFSDGVDKQGFAEWIFLHLSQSIHLGLFVCFKLFCFLFSNLLLPSRNAKKTKKKNNVIVSIMQTPLADLTL